MDKTEQSEMDEAKKTRKPKKNKKSIRRNLIVVILLMSLIPLIVVALVTAVISFNNAMNLEKEVALQRLETVKSESQKLINSTKDCLKVLAENKSVIECLKSPTKENTKDAEAALVSAIDGFSDDAPMFIFDKSGMQLARSDGGELNDISERAYTKPTLSGESVTSDVVISKSTNSKVTIITAPVKDDSGNIVGGIAKNAYVADLDNKMQELVNSYTNIIVLDTSGALVATSLDVDEETFDISSESYVKDAQSGDSAVKTMNFMGTKVLMAYEMDADSSWVFLCTTDYATASRSTMIMVYISGGILLLNTILIIVIGYMYASSIAKPIMRIADMTDRIASGDLNVDKMNIKRQDEVGSMVDSENILLDELGKVIHHAKEVTVKLSDESDSLAESTQDATDASGQITSAVDDISNGAVSQAESVLTAKQNTENIADCIEDITQGADSLDSYSKEMRTACDKAMETLDSLINQSKYVNSSASTISETINQTNTSVQTISDFTAQISNIATQTNLLSLNASIEAARAGEAGKGFAVVADEISKLAAQSGDSASQIGAIVDELLRNSDESVRAMNELNSSVETQAEQLKSTQENMEQMADDVEKVTHGSVDILEKTQTLTDAKNNLQEVIEDLAAISEENAASAQETNASMQQLDTTFDNISKSAHNLQSIAKQLEETISYFQ
ncbi:methyl-accepting chemotaxis sensory transducer with Cache sensor [Acetitomaculum ruminis DSM 5522]|uniref:Methyl-accepting chemotaxis sensory transducer with Cache sensor n=1 Tax=Acetitomaculum ruminis DSM 5522 TaxID=1120918 RepID=A0A1I0W2I4_9FIRM|nr:methyl-accepting chemotaxis protein [Acetitomaculum ruminis]SFA82821.1 methyl-accepting chemotaxis sensory transducer with Cache sensor [Acetitomaculum ruminis DSM 5522]